MEAVCLIFSNLLDHMLYTWIKAFPVSMHEFGIFTTSSIPQRHRVTIFSSRSWMGIPNYTWVLGEQYLDVMTMPLLVGRSSYVPTILDVQ